MLDTQTGERTCENLRDIEARIMSRLDENGFRVVLAGDSVAA